MLVGHNGGRRLKPALVLSGSGATKRRMSLSPRSVRKRLSYVPPTN